jgi:hypothetical protein
MRSFICVGLAIIMSFVLITLGIETGVLDCGGQPCNAHRQERTP